MNIKKIIKGIFIFLGLKVCEILVIIGGMVSIVFIALILALLVDLFLKNIILKFFHISILAPTVIILISYVIYRWVKDNFISTKNILNGSSFWEELRWKFK